GARPTATALRWRTPEYAAPEQVRGDEVTTFTDVWQLGVALFELLTGRLPFGERGAMPFALEEAVLYADPPAPSSF
ncbi:MAG: protein kinase, partial [Gemmatimonadetes bacterium]|nr:protein kinase [Gemmatimonadota bacterium]